MEGDHVKLGGGVGAELADPEAEADMAVMPDRYNQGSREFCIGAGGLERD